LARDLNLYSSLYSRGAERGGREGWSWRRAGGEWREFW